MDKPVIEPVIEFKDFGFKYGAQSKPTLHDINLSIYPGEKVLILGPSGSGKSTLANCINGLARNSFGGEFTGSCTVAGFDIAETSIFELSGHIGTVLQDSDAQFVGLSVGEDIAFTSENNCVPRSRMLDIVKEAAQIVGMDGHLDALPFDLSGGQKQKVALAGIMGENVKVLLFDEPLASLDPQMGMVAVDLIDRISKRDQTTVLIIEHRLEDVLYRPVDRVVLLSEGRIVADMPPDDIMRTELLFKHGIREPLYITAMKYSGCDLDSQPMLGDLAQMDLTADTRQKLLAFYNTPTESFSAPGSEAAVRLDNVRFAYEGKKYVINGISCEIRKGERVAVIGKNGAGKSTMARLICGVNRPASGDIYIDGIDAKEMSIKEIGEHVGYVMQNPNQMLVKDIIIDEVEVALKVREVPPDEAAARVKEALKTCQLWPMRKWPVDAISYGQKKRVTVADILAIGPEVIILDEPTAGQDYHRYTEIMDFLNRLNREHGITIVFITHDMHLALENTERAIVFADAEIIADDSVFEVLSDDETIQKANLKQTSLYILAGKLNIRPRLFIKHFIEYERMVKPGGHGAGGQSEGGLGADVPGAGGQLAGGQGADVPGAGGQLAGGQPAGADSPGGPSGDSNGGARHE